MSALSLEADDGLFRRDWPLILAYHSVSQHRTDGLAVPAGEFERQMDWLHRRAYRTVTVTEFINGGFSPDEPLALITFDDGYADNYDVAFPVLKRFGFVATVFLVSDFVGTGRTFRWDSLKIRSKADIPHYAPMNWEQVRDMEGYGIEMGSHTCSHPRLTTLAVPERWEEISRSRADIEDRLGHTVSSFCYPHSEFDQTDVDLVEKAGYACAVVTAFRRGIPLRRFTLRRVGVYQNTSSWRFRLKTTGLFRRNYERLKPKWQDSSTMLPV